MDAAMQSYFAVIRPYFDSLARIFGHLADEAERHKLPADTVARGYLSDQGRRERFAAEVEHICSQIKRFWETNARVLRAQLQTIPGLKAGFSGDIGPQLSDRVFERAGLYFDTIVLCDPLLHVAMLPAETFRTKDYYLMKYGIIQCQLREVYLAETTPPLAYLLGDPGMLAGPPATGPEAVVIAQADTVMLANELYGINLDSFDEVKRYFESLSSNQEAARNLARPELFLFEADAEREPEAQLAALLERTAQDIVPESMPWVGKGASLVEFVLLGRMGQAVDILRRTAEQGFRPLVTAPVSYHWMATKITLNQKQVSKELGVDIRNLAVTNALLAKTNTWLGNTTLEQLVILRRRNELAEIRSELTKNLETLSHASLDTLNSVVTQVDNNLKGALERHRDQLSNLDGQLRQKFAISVPSLLAGVVAALQPTFAAILPSWTAAIGGILGISSVKDFVSALVDYRRQRKALSKSPVGILWAARKKSEDQ